MDIFISWQGKRSHAVAEALRDWLPLIVNAFKPWLSSADIDKGARWGAELSTQLGRATAGIFCLTRSNLTAPWLIFEAGAISRTPEKTYVCTLLLDLQPSDVKGPLAQFQATKATKEDIHQLVKNLNKALGEHSMDEALVNRAFEMWWPELERKLKNLPSGETSLPPLRSDRELLEELVDLARATKVNLVAEQRADQLAAQLNDMRESFAKEFEANLRAAELSRRKMQDEMRRVQDENASRSLPPQLQGFADKLSEEVRRELRALRQPKPPKRTDESKS
ncbi:MAG: toll/interleukin-1 receptor domain-containing protein [Acidobacteriia bacterium]|nr:toll/interleukin-1 receptor domain-containing protein [Terriglobia bacterium]